MLIIKKIEKYDTHMMSNVYLIRRKVFIENMNLNEVTGDKKDKEAVHYIAMENGEPAGTIRYRKIPEPYKIQCFNIEPGYEIEKVAVLSEFSGKGIATSMIKQVLNDIYNLPDHTGSVALWALGDVCSLYEKIGFRLEGHYTKRVNTNNLEITVSYMKYYF